jgi:8-oxo-dGTP pyrophosphatase MutT (NUDIX family)
MLQPPVQWFGLKTRRVEGERTVMKWPVTKRLSCGVVILNDQAELLLCHVTGHSHWDLPKGGIHSGETPLQAALRETEEESGLVLQPDALLDLGPLPYRPNKGLHLFAALLPRLDTRELHCASCFTDARSERRLPEMDGFGWFAFDRISSLCTPRMAVVLQERLQLAGILRRLQDLRDGASAHADAPADATAAA